MPQMEPPCGPVPCENDFSMDEFLLLKNKRPYPTKDKTKVYTPPVYMLTNMSFRITAGCRRRLLNLRAALRSPFRMHSLQPLPPSGPLSEGRRHPYYFSICGLTYYGFTIASPASKSQEKKGLDIWEKVGYTAYG